jgi:hypothetical protein
LEPTLSKRTVQVLGAAVVAVVLVAVGVLVGMDLNRSGQRSEQRATPSQASRRGFPDEGIPTTTRPNLTVAQLTIGQTADLAVVDVPAGDTGAVAPMLTVDASRPTIARMAATKVKVTTGDEFDHPERGLYLGIYVKLLSLTDGLASKANGSLYVAMRGHRYDQTTYAAGFEPTYEFNDLNAGEAIEGWLVFDVPDRHGQLIAVDSFEGRKVAVWKF